MSIATARNSPKYEEPQLHIPSHQRLVSSRRYGPATGPAPLPDAVVVPAARGRGTLRHAAGVARQARCTLVVIASKDLTAEAAAAELADGEALPPRVLIVELGDQTSSETIRLNLATSRFNTVSDMRCDTSDKRNLGLLAARRLGWERVLFLDDDVCGLGQAELDRTAWLMDRRGGRGEEIQAVGWTFTANDSDRDCTPDNSVVCHAHRLTGGQQETFIGAGSLLTRVNQDTPFFPKVYNEDWLFLLPPLATGGVLLAGELNQRAFDPFADPRRARWEEFGDVLAESLYSLLHEVRYEASDPMELIWDKGTDPEWWAHMIDRRRRFIDLIQARLHHQQTRIELLDSLDAARHTLRPDWSTLLAEYVGHWRADLEVWREALANRAVPIADRPVTDLDVIAGVFAGLGLSGARTLVPQPARRRWAAAR